MRQGSVDLDAQEEIRAALAAFDLNGKGLVAGMQRCECFTNQKFGFNVYAAIFYVCRMYVVFMYAGCTQDLTCIYCSCIMCENMIVLSADDLRYALGALGNYPLSDDEVCTALATAQLTSVYSSMI